MDIIIGILWMMFVFWLLGKTLKFVGGCLMCIIYVVVGLIALWLWSILSIGALILIGGVGYFILKILFD